jgi:membrane protein YdbS with pleckstrin-like domain
MTGVTPGGDAAGIEEWRALAPAAVRWHSLSAILLVPLPLIATVFVPLFAPSLDPALARTIAFGISGLLVLNVARTVVWFRRFRFRLTDSTAETRARVLGVTTRVVPLGRIQHVDVTAGPVERLLEIANVSAHTAAGEATIVIPGLGLAAAELVREGLLKERRREAV